MSKIAYTVHASFQHSDVADEWVDWLMTKHVKEVLEAGAMDAELVEADQVSGETSRAFEVRYHFPSREAFERYEREHAPRLRAEGLAMFPAERGIGYRRSLGVVLD